MPRSSLVDAFEHHVWATLRLIDACSAIDPGQIETPVSGTYGSILDTVRHLVDADAGYLFFLTGERTHATDPYGMDLPELRGTMERNGRAWSGFLAEEPDAGDIVREVDEGDGYERDAPVGIRLAQTLHHGSDHRSQICTSLTNLGVQPPSIDVWDFGLEAGRISEKLPT